MRSRLAWLLVAGLILAANTLIADVLVLRDGRRIEGLLVGVRDDAIEFEQRDTRGTWRVVRYDRSEIRSIEFDDPRRAGDRYRDDPRGTPAMRERTVSAEARVAWTDTGINVRFGQQISFVATGTVRWGPNRRDGAAGERNSPYNAARPMPDRPAAALIGKIGADGDPFFIGDSTELLRMRGDGRLFLGINDDFLTDNSGSLRVVISY